MSTLEQCMSSLGPDQSHRLGPYRCHIEYFYATRLACITAGSHVQRCVYCHQQKVSCRQAWTCIVKGVQLLNRRSLIPETISDFASYLGIASALNLRYTEARRAIDSLGCPVDDTLGRLRKSLSSVTFRGNSTIQALLYGATSDMWFRCEKLCAFRPLNETTAVDEIRELGIGISYCDNIQAFRQPLSRK